MPNGIEIAFLPLRAIVGPVFNVAFRVKTIGRENIPRTGAALLAANHASFLDPILIATRARRPVRFLVAHDFYRDPRLHMLLRWLGTIPVGGDIGIVGSFRRVGEVIGEGGLVGIFPEGGITRDGAMRPFRSGAAMIALRTGVPVVPIHVGGTFAALPRYAKWPRFVPVTLSIGEPIAVAARAKPSSDDVAALTETLRNAIGALDARETGAR